jgi:hypothetical protein
MASSLAGLAGGGRGGALGSGLPFVAAITPPSAAPAPARAPLGLFVVAACAAGRRLQRRHDARAVLHDALQGAGAPLVEVQAARHRLEPHLQVLDLDPQAGRLEHQVMDELVVQ